MSALALSLGQGINSVRAPIQPTFHLVAWVVLERADGAVLLARRHGVSYGEGLWALPGGHVNDDETLAEAAVRETLEEVGVRVAVEDLEPLGTTRYVDGGHRGVDFFFRSRSWSGEPSVVAECSEIGWHHPDDLPADSLAWLDEALHAHLDRGPWLHEHVDPAPARE